MSDGPTTQPQLRHKNWGRWGTGDERGMANVLDGPTVLEACRTPRSGKVYDLGMLLQRNSPVVGARVPPIHLMSLDGGDFAALGNDDSGFADDYIFVACHGTTHVDALSHVWSEGKMFNGYPFTEVRSSGAARCGIEKLGGLVTTAHVLDFVDRPTSRPLRIASSDIEEYVQEHNLPVRPGDALLFRTGWLEAWQTGSLGARELAHVDPDAAAWIADHDISIVGADNLGVEEVDADDSMTLHHRLLIDLGVYILELLNLRGPAEDRVRSGMFVVAPLLIRRAVGSPVNPVLVA